MTEFSVYQSADFQNRDFEGLPFGTAISAATHAHINSVGEAA